MYEFLILFLTFVQILLILFIMCSIIEKNIAYKQAFREGGGEERK